MSSMKATRLAPARPPSRSSRAARRDASRRPGARTRGRASAGSSASACGTTSFSACAPRLPPTTSRRSGPLRAGEALRAARAARRSRARTGIAGRTSRLRAARRETPTRTRSATPREHAVGEPGDRVLLVHHERPAEQRRPSCRRETRRSRPCRARRRADARRIARALCQNATQQVAAAAAAMRSEALAAQAGERTQRHRVAALAARASLPCPSRAPSHTTRQPRAAQLRRPPPGRERRVRRCRRP